MAYGPNFSDFEWVVVAGTSQSVRVECDTPMDFEIEWTDPSVSWEKYQVGKWNFDISQARDVTLFLRGDVGEYKHTHNIGGPRVVQSVCLKHYVEIACDNEIPFIIKETPVTNMYWSNSINIDTIVQHAEV